MRAKTVLIVEDTPELRDGFSTILQHAGYGVIQAENGEQGVQRAREHHPDLILMDLSMPVLDGRGATEQIKADPSVANIPIVAATGRVLFREDRERLRRTGFAACLHKPFPPGQLLEQIRSAIGPAVSTASA